MGIMAWLKLMIVGIVQGLTEPLPISSSGHMVIAQYFMNLPIDSLFLEIVLNFASLIAIVIFFRKRIMFVVTGTLRYIFKREEADYKAFRFAVLIVVGTIPAGFGGWLFGSYFVSLLSLLTVGLALLVTGSFLWLVQRHSLENEREELTFNDALFIGMFQLLALLPGISRSGATVTGGLLKKIKFETVFEYSFMLYIPISIAAMGYEIYGMSDGLQYDLLPLSAAFMATTITTYFALKFFLFSVRSGYLKYFAWYCFFIGTFSIVLYFI